MRWLPVKSSNAEIENQSQLVGSLFIAAEKELSALFTAVNGMFGAEQARESAIRFEKFCRGTARRNQRMGNDTYKWSVCQLAKDHTSHADRSRQQRHCGSADQCAHPCGAPSICAAHCVLRFEPRNDVSTRKGVP
jgi:hypothetical protein